MWMNAVRWTIAAAYLSLLTGMLVVQDPWAWLRGGPAAPEVLRGVSDKTLHAGAYTALGWLLCWATRCRIPLACAIFVALHGAATEIIQANVEGRSGDFWDWNADLAGGCGGILLYLLLFGKTKP